MTALKKAKNENIISFEKFDEEYQRHSNKEIDDVLNFKRSVNRWMNGITFPKDKVTKESISVLLTRNSNKFGAIVIPNNTIVENLVKNIIQELQTQTNLKGFKIYNLTRIINNPLNDKLTNKELLQAPYFLLLQLYALQNHIFDINEITVNQAITYEKVLNLIDLDKLTKLLREYVYFEDHLTEQRLEKQVLIYLLDRLSGSYLLTH